MAHIYIALVDTPGFFAMLIRKFIKLRYIHVVLSADANMDEAYSVGRRMPSVPIIAGFEREYKEKIFRAFPTAAYRIYELECTSEQKRNIMARLRADYKNRFHIHYAVIGILPLTFGIPFYIKNQYTCSSYSAKLLKENGITISDKHFSLITPRDFYEYPKLKMIFEGKLSQLTMQKK